MGAKASRAFRKASLPLKENRSFQAVCTRLSGYLDQAAHQRRSLVLRGILVRIDADLAIEELGRQTGGVQKAIHCHRGGARRAACRRRKKLEAPQQLVGIVRKRSQIPVLKNKRAGLTCFRRYATLRGFLYVDNGMLRRDHQTEFELYARMLR